MTGLRWRIRPALTRERTAIQMLNGQRYLITHKSRQGIWGQP
jgi:hypothetical protein